MEFKNQKDECCIISLLQGIYNTSLQKKSYSKFRNIQWSTPPEKISSRNLSFSFDNEANSKVKSIPKVSETKVTYGSILDRPVVKRLRQRNDWKYLTKNPEAYSKAYNEEEARLESEENNPTITCICEEIDTPTECIDSNLSYSEPKFQLAQSPETIDLCNIDNDDPEDLDNKQSPNTPETIDLSNSDDPPSIITIHPSGQIEIE